MRPRTTFSGVAITSVVVLLCVVPLSVLRGLSWPRGVHQAWLTANAARLRGDEPLAPVNGTTAHSAAAADSARTLVLYHITVSGRWQETVRDQVTKLIFSGLYERLSLVHCTVAGAAHNATAEARLYLSSYGSKFTAVGLSGRPTISRSIASMHDLTATDRVLVMSTWGAASAAASEAAADAYLWRTLMEYKLI